MTSVPSSTRLLREVGKQVCGSSGKNADAFHTALKSFAARVELWEHPAGYHGIAFELRDGREVEPAKHGAVSPFYSGDVREKDERLGVSRDGGRGGHLIGIDVVVLAVKAESDGANDGNGTHSPDGVKPLGISGGDLADEA